MLLSNLSKLNAISFELDDTCFQKQLQRLQRSEIKLQSYYKKLISKPTEIFQDSLVMCFESRFIKTDKLFKIII